MNVRAKLASRKFHQKAKLAWLESHIIHNHQNVRNFHCGECDYASNYLTNFERHQKEHHDLVPVPGNFRCPYCPKIFYVEAKLRSHMLVHKDDRNFGCDECAAKFKRKDDLKVHMKIHLPADIRAVEKAKKLTKECETCGKKFEKNWKLKRHMVVHTKDSSNAFVELVAEPKAEVVVPEEQKFIVMNNL